METTDAITGDQIQRIGKELSEEKTRSPQTPLILTDELPSGLIEHIRHESSLKVAELVRVVMKILREEHLLKEYLGCSDCPFRCFYDNNRSEK